MIRGIGNVIFGVRDLEAAGARLAAAGLHVEEGGRHEAFGTRNLIVPLGASYLELLAVEDRERAEASEFGRSLLARIADGDRLTRWSLRVDGIDELAASVGVEVDDRSRRHPDGRLLQWRSAGMAESLRDPSRPFLMQWPDEDWPGTTDADQHLAWFEVTPSDLVAVGLRVGAAEVVIGD